MSAARLLHVAALSAVVLGLATGQSLPAPAQVSSSYTSRLLTEYGADGGGWLTPAGLQRLLEQLGVSRHQQHGHGHQQHGHGHQQHGHGHQQLGHTDHTDHEHSQRAPADHESGLEHRDGGGVSGAHAAHPATSWHTDHNHGADYGTGHGTDLLHELEQHHALSHDHGGHDHAHHVQDGRHGADHGPDHGTYAHDHGPDHGTHAHDHGPDHETHAHDHGSDHETHAHDHGSGNGTDAHDHGSDHETHAHDHGSDHETHAHDHGSDHETHAHDHGSGNGTHAHDHGSDHETHAHDHGSDHETHAHDHGSDHETHAHDHGSDHETHAHDHGSDHETHAHDHGSDHETHAHDHGSDHETHAHDHGSDHETHGNETHGPDHETHDHETHGPDHDHGPSTDHAPAEKPLSRDTREARPQDVSPAKEVAATISTSSCPDAGQLLSEFGLPADGRLSADSLALLCPALVYHAATAADSCGPTATTAADLSEPHQPLDSAAGPSTKLWLFASLSVLVISLCGLAGVAVVPIMQRVFYRQLLQFLVALAVGTLAGDALLHLLPHALTPHAAHSEESGHVHGDEDGHSGHLDAVLKGLVALVSLVFFFAAERGIGILHGTCTRASTKKINKRLADMPGLSREHTEMIEKKINDYRHSAGANHCFADRDTLDVLARLNTTHEHDSCPVEDSDPDADNHNQTPDCSQPLTAGAASCGSQPTGHGHQPDQPLDSEAGASAVTAAGRPSRSDDTCERFDTEEPVARSNDFTVIIHEHEHRHHGHTHTHGHIHQPGGSAAAVAGMVIVGDGLHNFTDGMAIGAAFAAGMASGISTSVAVFCHELPHEIGDFAVLLQSGMSVRQALFYNVVSSVLCLVGMVLGMVLGNIASFSSWVFAAAAGSFLYIALVDMVPELTAGSGDAGSSPCSQLAIQLAGMTCGAAIMLTIAIYENDLHSMFTVL